jgi:integrase
MSPRIVPRDPSIATIDPQSSDPFDPVVAAVDRAAEGRYLDSLAKTRKDVYALERRDLDLEAAVLSVERVYSQRVLKEPKKSSRQRRRVPLRARVVQALRELPPRLDTPLLFPATRGGHIDDNKWRWREWTPALRAAGI